MKVLPFKIPKPESLALIYQEDKELRFYNKLHQHEEIQISIILHGEGDLVVGDTINRYQKGDVFVIGSNLPHLFKSEEGSNEESFMKTLFFTKESFGKFFFELLELKELDALFRKLDGGIKLLSDQEIIFNHFEKLAEATQLERFIEFLTILKLISKAETSSLSSSLSMKSRIFSALAFGKSAV
ncbi:MAG: cupin domain-containing protein [Crocinitomicaceae bacterium]